MKTRAALWAIISLGSGLLTGCDDQEKTMPNPMGGEAIAGEVMLLAGEEVAGDTMIAGEEAGDTPMAPDYDQIKLNEFAAQGEPFDWVELINMGEESINLAGCGLSDDDTNLSRYIIPEGEEAIIPAGGYALYILSSESTGFALGSDELIVLSTPRGQLIDLVDYERNASPYGASYGRLPDGTGEWQTLYAPSPSAPNELGMPPVCGDAICDPLEECAEDCVVCGDGLCDEGEVCIEDCSICGDQRCDEGEMCPFDCQDLECGDGICSPSEECEEDCRPVDTLIINEIIAAGVVDGIELVNVGEDVVDLSEFRITDTPTLPFRGVLSGELEVGAYLWIEITDTSLGFKLGGDEEILLYHQNGTLIQHIDWEEGDAPEGSSYRRSPDLTGEFSTGPQSPGQPND